MEHATHTRVAAVIGRVVGSSRIPPDVGPATPLGEGGLWLDSIELLEALIACQHEFGIVLSSEDDLTPEAMETVGSLTRLLEARCRA